VVYLQTFGVGKATGIRGFKTTSLKRGKVQVIDSVGQRRPCMTRLCNEKKQKKRKSKLMGPANLIKGGGGCEKRGTTRRSRVGETRRMRGSGGGRISLAQGGLTVRRQVENPNPSRTCDPGGGTI